MNTELTPVKPPSLEILLVTGMSGAGKSTASHALEDKGWYVVDNLPPELFLTMAELVGKDTERDIKLALVVDIRSHEFSNKVQEAITQLRVAGVEVRILFLDCTDEVLVRRFETLRRPHPLQEETGRILDGITAERQLLSELRSQAELLIDTSAFNVHELTTATAELFSDEGPIVLRINVMSFGFKYGVPADANFIADVRFVPNPHWVPELRPFTGQDAPVAEYVLQRDGVEEFLENYVKALKPVLEGYRAENKHYATFAIGCTGGKHRSVAITEEFARRIRQHPGVVVSVTHRDMGRE